MKSFMKKAKDIFCLIKTDREGNVAVEFALCVPVMMILTAGGIELVNLAVTIMRIQQVALQVADNGSRIGEGSLLAALKIYEANINDVFAGAEAQAGDLKLYGTHTIKLNGNDVSRGNSRIVMTSLEPVASPNPTNKYKIGWQRCKGGLTSYTPKYGTVGQSSGQNMNGMGPSGQQVTVPDNSSVIFVEVRYRYRPLFTMGYTEDIFGADNLYKNIDATAAMIVRDDRDTTQVYASDGVTASTC